MGTECKRRIDSRWLGVGEWRAGGVGCIKANGRFLSENQPHCLHGIDPFHNWNRIWFCWRTWPTSAYQPTIGHHHIFKCTKYIIFKKSIDFSWFCSMMVDSGHSTGSNLAMPSGITFDFKICFFCVCVNVSFCLFFIGFHSWFNAIVAQLKRTFCVRRDWCACRITADRCHLIENFRLNLWLCDRWLEKWKKQMAG